LSVTIRRRQSTSGFESAERSPGCGDEPLVCVNQTIVRDLVGWASVPNGARRDVHRDVLQFELDLVEERW
jgi:hypothetical protein